MSKPKSDVKVLKGQEAEDKILDYFKRMNRPFGAIDVTANLKGAVQKTATVKILSSLAERGELSQKTYNKTTLYVINQAKLDTVPPEKAALLEEEYKRIDEENKVLVGQLKSVNNELAKIRGTPSDDELKIRIAEIAEEVEKKTAVLQPLRAGNNLLSAEDIAQIDTEWAKWRVEWLRRKKIFNVLWGYIKDSMDPRDADNAWEDLGIESDTPEHATLEISSLCRPGNNLKRKR